MHELLTNEEMREADRRAVALGVPSLTLMENAGRAVANEAAKMVSAGARIAVLCGPGNNGGDGFVAARLLRRRGFDARVHLLGDKSALKGDAAEMARQYEFPIWPANQDALQSMHLIIDALFGAGLSRRLDGEAADLVKAANASRIPVLSIDVPSGLDGNTGVVRGNVVIDAEITVTFFRKKPGHLLLPGRALCGEVIVADIGVPEDALRNPPPPLGGAKLRLDAGEGLGVGGLSRAESQTGSSALAASTSDPRQSAHVFTPPPTPPRQGEGGRDGPPQSSALPISTFENHPALWHSQFPFPCLDAHKYTRGHAVVVSGPPHQTGAARLAARGALRIGAGLVTVAASPQALLVNAAHLTAIMLTPFGSARDFAEILEDKRKNAVLIGPGCGVGAETRDLCEAALASGASVALDADALTSFAAAQDEASPRAGFGFTAAAKTDASSPAALFFAIRAREDRSVVMTPHEGEFARLFPDVAPLGSSKLDRARAAAKLSGAIVVLKGPDTVIAAPNGSAAINANAPPTLATAGSGDVLAGFITGLLAQGMPAFEAACASVWLHGECANAFGPGLIAEDLAEQLPGVLGKLQSRPE